METNDLLTSRVRISYQYKLPIWYEQITNFTLTNAHMNHDTELLQFSSGVEASRCTYLVDSFFQRLWELRIWVFFILDRRLLKLSYNLFGFPMRKNVGARACGGMLEVDEQKTAGDLGSASQPNCKCWKLHRQPTENTGGGTVASAGWCTAGSTVRRTALIFVQSMQDGPCEVQFIVP